MTAVSAPETGDLRAAALACRTSGDLHGFVDLAVRHLAQAEDPQLLVLAVQALACLHLAALALELLDRTELEGTELDIDELRRLLEQVPSGRLDRSDDDLARNLEALRRHHPEVGIDAAELRRRAETITIDRCIAGARHASRVVNGRRAFIHRVRNDAKLAGFDLSDTLKQGDHAPLVLRCEPNELIHRVFETSRTDSNLRSIPVFVVEPDLDRFAAWLLDGDHTDELEQARGFFFVGPDAVERYRAFLLGHDALDTHTILIGAEPGTALREAVDGAATTVRQAREAKVALLCSGIVERDQDRTAEDCARRLSPGARIVGFTSRHTTMLQYSMRDIGEALTDLGFNFHLLREPDDHSRHNSLTLMRTVSELDPALVVLINHLRPPAPMSLGSVPVLTWIQDPNEEILSTSGVARFGPHDALAGFYSDQCVQRFGYPESRVHPIGFVPVSQSMFHDKPLPHGEASRWTADVAYIGHLHHTPESQIDHCIDTYPPELHQLVARIRTAVDAELKMNHVLSRKDCEHIVDVEAAALGCAMPDEVKSHAVSHCAYRYFDLHFRLETLRWVADWAARTNRRFRLYGLGWEQIPEFGPFAAGPVEHGEESRCAYRGARITIQTIPSGLAHQRTYEAFCSGSLVLGRYVPINFAGLDIEGFRREHGDGSDCTRSLYSLGFRGIDRIVFDGAERFEELAERYLEQADARESLVHEFRDIVHRNCTYEAVMPHVLDTIRGGLTQ